MALHAVDGALTRLLLHCLQALSMAITQIPLSIIDATLFCVVTYFMVSCGALPRHLSCCLPWCWPLSKRSSVKHTPEGHARWHTRCPASTLQLLLHVGLADQAAA
jgi:hypothetical protein